MKNLSVCERRVLGRTTIYDKYCAILLIALLGVITIIPQKQSLAVAQQETAQQSAETINEEIPSSEVEADLTAEEPNQSSVLVTQNADFWRKKIKENLPTGDDSLCKASTLGVLLTVLDHPSAIDLALFDRAEDGIQRLQRMCPALAEFFNRSDARQVIQAAKTMPEEIIKEFYPEKVTLIPYYIDCISAWFLQAGGGGTHSVEAIPRLE